MRKMRRRFSGLLTAVLGIGGFFGVIGGAADIGLATSAALASPLSCSGFPPTQVAATLAETAGTPPDPAGYYVLSAVTLRELPAGCDGASVSLAFYGNRHGDPQASSHLLGRTSLTDPWCSHAAAYIVALQAVAIPLCPGISGHPGILSYDVTKIVWTVATTTGTVVPPPKTSPGGGTTTTTTSAGGTTTTTTSGGTTTTTTGTPGGALSAGGGTGGQAGNSRNPEVSTKAASGGTGVLAFTGSNIAGSLLVGVLALVVGSLLSMVARRRRRHAALEGQPPSS